MTANVVNHPLIERSNEILVRRDLVANICRADFQIWHIDEAINPECGHSRIETLVNFLDELLSRPRRTRHDCQLSELEYPLPVLPLGKRQKVVRPDEQVKIRILAITLT